jgi:hypothetical protein
LTLFADVPATAPKGATTSASAVPAGAEALAGEERAAPTAVPTPDEDEGGPKAVSRSQRVAPSFALPAFVVTGGGERQALAARGELGADLDTSGGIKTSPGETGAGKDQRAAEAVRAAPEQETFSSRPAYGEIEGAYGLGNTLNLSGLLGGQKGPYYGWLEGAGHTSDGGPLSASTDQPDERRSGSLSGRGGWRSANGDLVEGGLDGEWRGLRLDRSTEPDAWLQRSRESGDLAWEGSLAGTRSRIQVSGDEARLALPQGVYNENGANLDWSGQRDTDSRWGRLAVDSEFGLGLLNQSEAGDSRSLTLLKGVVEARGEPWAGARLGLGVLVGAIFGGVNVGGIAPKLDFEQRLTRALGLRLSYGASADFSRLEGVEFQQDERVPNPKLIPSRRVCDVRGALTYAAGAGLSVEAGGWIRENLDAFLPDDSAETGVWTDTGVGELRVEGLRLGERWGGGHWRENAELLIQQGQLPGLPGDTVTFLPPWKAALSVGWKGKIGWAEGALLGRGQREARLEGGWTLAPDCDLRLRVGKDLRENLSVFAEGDSLAGAVQEFPDGAEASPYLGLGAKASF